MREALALLLVLAAAAPVPAQSRSSDPSIASLRLATCAALWQGHADVLGDDGQRALAARFAAAAGRLVGEAEARAMIAERRPWMVDLLRAYIHHRDDQSHDLFERLVTGCGPLAADLPLIGR